MDFQTPVLLFTSAARIVNFLNFASTSLLIFLIIYWRVDQFNKVKNEAYKIADLLGSTQLVKNWPTITVNNYRLVVLLGLG